MDVRYSSGSSVVKCAREEKIPASVLITYSRKEPVPWGLLCNPSVIFNAKQLSNATLT